MHEVEINAISPGPYQWGIIQAGPTQAAWVEKMLSFGSGDIHGIYLPGHADSVTGSDPERPEHWASLCITGNGPNSKNNAKALCLLLTQREIVKDKPTLPIPTTPECVAWAEYAMGLEHALGISDPIPERLKNMSVDDILNWRAQKGATDVR